MDDDENACFVRRETRHIVSLMKSSQYLEKTVPERSWSDLQPEMLSLIISNLFLWDSSNFNATCKSWKSIFPPFPPPSGSTLSKLPYLMILNGSDIKFFQFLRNEMYRKEILELKNARIRFSKYGWLLMSHGESSMFFFHPFTMVKIKLPDLPRRNCFKNISFLSPPTSSDCMVIGIEFCLFLGIIKRGEDKWTFHEIGHRKRFIISDASPVRYNGKIYCLGEAGNVGVLDLLSNKECCWDVCGNPITKWPCYKHRQSFTVKCDGGILVVFVIHEDRRIEVKKLNLPELVWEDVQSLGDKMLYVSHKACLLENAVQKGMGNKIYFPKFYGDRGIFYSLDTGMYHSIVGNYASRTSFNLAEQQSCTWIKATGKFSSQFLVIKKNLDKGWLDL